MRPQLKMIRLELQEPDGTPIEDFLIEDDPDTGVEIRNRGQSRATSGATTEVDVDHKHCEGCRADKTIGDLIGLTAWEVEAITDWRLHARAPKEDREVSGAQLGDILDKIVKKLEEDAPDCETVTERLTLKVEHE